MKSIRIVITLSVLVLFISCMKKETSPEIAIEFGGTTVYYVSNESGVDLNVTYKITQTTIDSTVALPAGNTTEIFQWGGLGGYFFPSEVFDNLIFTGNSNDDEAGPLLTFDSVSDNDWKTVPGEEDNKAGFKLTITQEDID